MTNPTFTGGLTLRGAKATFEYLLNERVEAGEAYVLEGNPKVTLNVIAQAAKKQKWCWSSGVLSFEEKVDDDILREIAQEHKKTFFPGLDENQFDITYIVHADKDRSEIHYIAPRMELSTGLAYNPYFVKTDFVKKDLFQQFINTKYGFSNPLDPERKKLTATNMAVWAKTKKSLLKQIDEYILPLVENGTVSDRKGVIQKIREAGLELANDPTNKKFITIINPSDPAKTHRLQGAIYSPEFQGKESLQEHIKAAAEKKGFNRPLAEIEKDLNRFIDRDAKFNSKKYKKKELKDADRTPADYPREESRAISKRRDYRRAVSEADERIDSLNAISNHFSRSSEGTEGEPSATNSAAEGITRDQSVQRAIDSTAQRTEGYVNITDEDYRAIGERRERNRHQRRVKERFISVISELGEELNGLFERVTAKVKETFTAKKPTIESILDQEEDNFQGLGGDGIRSVL